MVEAVIEGDIAASGGLDISIANGIQGSRTGSQRPQIQGYTWPHPATAVAAKQHVRRHLALQGNTSKVPPKQ